MRLELRSQKIFFCLALMAHGILLFSHFRDPRIDQAVPIRLTFTKIGGGSGTSAKMVEPVRRMQEQVSSKKPKLRKNILAEKIARIEKKEQGPTTEVQDSLGGAGGAGAGHGIGQGEGVSSSDPMKLYGSRIREFINKKKIYPAMARRMEQQGLVVMKLTLDKDGKLLDLQMLKKSPFGSLNEAAMQMVKNVEQFPPVPAEFKHEVVSFDVPIEYKLN